MFYTVEEKVQPYLYSFVHRLFETSRRHVFLTRTVDPLRLLRVYEGHSKLNAIPFILRMYLWSVRFYLYSFISDLRHPHLFPFQ